MTGIALVTGASRGLGSALAVALAARGWHIVAVARTVGALEDLDDRIAAAGGSATLAPLDIAQDEALAHLCRSVHDRWGHVDLLAHAAVHAAPLSPAGHIDAKDWDRSIAVNLRATGVLIAMAEPLLRAAQGRGRALFFDDRRGGDRFFGAYGATKAGQIALARSWQAEAARIGPEVLVEAPPAMATATRARFFPGEDRTALAAPAAVAEALAARLFDGPE